NSDHWAYAGTGLRDGDELPGLVGYESDRVMNEYPGPVNTDWTVLSESPVHTDEGIWDVANSSIYRAESGAWVFATGTLQWSWGLDDFGRQGFVDRRIQRVTANVLDRLLTDAP